MKWTDGAGRYGAEIDHAAYRPDLPDCKTCDNGTACACAIRLRMDPKAEPFWCGCMGFLSCPDCPRTRTGLFMSTSPSQDEADAC